MIRKKPDSTIFNQFLLASSCTFGLLIASYSNANAEVRSGNYKEKVAYVTGGFGQEERDEIKQHSKDYSIHLNFAKSNERSYLSNVNVVIKDKDAKTVFEQEKTGPFLFINLPQGEYEAKFTSNGQTKEHKISIQGKKPQQMIITWS